MHVCSRIVKVYSTKSTVIISSKDRDTPPLSIIRRYFDEGRYSWLEVAPDGGAGAVEVEDARGVHDEGRLQKS